ncbi:hypothetical protein DFH28DRAFT_36280 [Melampsora americana]|nr:hypothetical protein DFH28DRAFT_435717 [Melampsora americana]KAH9819717.1 hypothetical protein DFH28DRAFT_36280 [Melampsora americana]
MFSTNNVLSFISVVLLLSIRLPETFSADLGAGIIDLSPRITPEITFYIDCRIDFDQSTKIYEATGQSLYHVSPTAGDPGAITLQDDQSSDQNTSIRLDEVKCVSGAQWPPYFLDASAKGWTLKDSSHQPTDFMSVYKATSQATLPGEIQTYGSSQITLAKISTPQSGPATIPKGEYYTLNIIENRGHDPFVNWDDALALVLKLIQYSRLCDHTQ